MELQHTKIGLCNVDKCLDKEYKGALQYQAQSSNNNTNKAPQGKKASRSINCVLQFDVKLSIKYSAL